mmetsp:Transcript_6940/g.12343  ORF Transcript_6940/g.12343 Transcript_6940/m.12343 type:complete len:843 (+) Transcript_6940:77-2605(+)
MASVGRPLQCAGTALVPCISHLQGPSTTRVRNHGSVGLSGGQFGEERHGIAALGFLAVIAGAWLLRTRRRGSAQLRRRCRPEEEGDDGAAYQSATGISKVDAVQAKLHDVLGVLQTLQKQLEEAKREEMLINPVPKHHVPAVDDKPVTRLKRPSRAHQRVAEWDVPEGVTVVKTVAEAKTVVKKLCTLRDRVHAVDTEVMGWNSDRSPYTCGTVFAFSIFCGDDVDFGNGPRLFINDLDENSMLRGVLIEFKEYLEDAGIKKVLHNYCFDKAVLLRSGIRLDGLIGDTMHMARMLPGHSGAVSLATLSKRHLPAEYHKNALKNVAQQCDCSPSEPEKMHLSGNPNARSRWIHYTVKDTVATWHLYQVLHEKLKKQGFLHAYETYWIPLAKQLSEMEEVGIPISAECILRQKAIAEQDLQHARQAFQEWLAEKWKDDEELMQTVGQVSATNHTHVRHLLYGVGKAHLSGGVVVLGMALPYLGEESLGVHRASVLELAHTCINRLTPADIHGMHALAHMRAYLKRPKKHLENVEENLQSTPCADRVQPGWGFILPGGGLQHTKPDLDNLKELSDTRWPQNDGAGYLSIVSPEDGKALVRVEFCHPDLQIVARLSECKQLDEVFGEGEGDVASRIAAKVFHHGHELGERKQWDKAQVAETITKAVLRGDSTETLADILDVSSGTAAELKRLWHAAFPEVLTWFREWHDQCFEEAGRGNATLRSLHGRKVWTRKDELRNEDDSKVVIGDDASSPPYLARLVESCLRDLIIEVVAKASCLAHLDFRLVMCSRGAVPSFTFEGPEQNVHEASEALRRLLRSALADHGPWAADHSRASDVVTITTTARD